MKISNNRPSFEEESLLWQKGIKFIAGADEVGRGCFAGPIVAAAVILPSNFTPIGEINDSKLLNAKKRYELSRVILNEALCYSISIVNLSYINKFGIGKANQLVLKKAIKNLSIKPEYILVDGFEIINIRNIKQKALIKGDCKSVSVASASIIAKVYRDELMQNISSKYEKYGFYSNKGYGTKDHRDAISRYGLSRIHRKSFNLQRFLH